MKYIIKTGEHESKPRTWGLWKDKIILEREVIFHESCKYTNSGQDIDDVNKLFGIGFFPKGPIDAFIGRWITGKYTDEDFHHTDSARFGWTYNPVKANIILWLYCYVDGNRKVMDMLHVPMYVPITCRITISPSGYQFTTHTANLTFTSTPVYFSHKKHWSFLLNPYFGGNLTAPHDVEITLNKI